LGFGRDINASRESGEDILETITTHLRAQKQKRRVTMALLLWHSTTMARHCC
jgi:5-carboxymethyl-2-hydroxymuconate isomerase